MDAKKLGGEKFARQEYASASSHYRFACDQLRTAAVKSDDTEFQLKMEFEYARVENNMALCALKLGKFAEAQSHAVTAIGMDKLWAKPFYTMARAYYEMKQLPEALTGARPKIF